MAADHLRPARQIEAAAATSALVVRRAVIDQVGPFDEVMTVGEWFDWYARLVDTGWAIDSIDDLLVRRRLHGANNSLRQRDNRSEYLQVLRAHLGRTRPSPVSPRPVARSASPSHRPAWLPSGLDQQLLRVALLDDDRAAAAWHELRPQLDLDTIDWDQHRLMPLVERGLRRSGVDDPDLGRLRGIHRQSWSRNQLLLRRTAPALARLEAEGIADGGPQGRGPGCGLLRRPRLAAHVRRRRAGPLRAARG